MRPATILPVGALRGPARRTGPRLWVEGMHGLHIPDVTALRHAIVRASSALHAQPMIHACMYCIAVYACSGDMCYRGSMWEWRVLLGLENLQGGS